MERGSHESVSSVTLTTVVKVSRSLDQGGARGSGVGESCRKSAQPGIGRPRRAPPERRHNHVSQSAAPSWSVQRSKAFS